MEHYFIQTCILVYFLVLLQYPKKIKCTNKVHLTDFWLKICLKVRVGDGEVFMFVIAVLSVVERGLTFKGRGLTFKECELLEQCLRDVQKVLIDMEHNAPGWCLTGSCLNKCYFNTMSTYFNKENVFLMSDCINNKSAYTYVYKDC